jgi:hypothetical protein
MTDTGEMVKASQLWGDADRSCTIPCPRWGSTIKSLQSERDRAFAVCEEFRADRDKYRDAVAITDAATVKVTAELRAELTALRKIRDRQSALIALAVLQIESFGNHADPWLRKWAARARK